MNRSFAKKVAVKLRFDDLMQLLDPHGASLEQILKLINGLSFSSPKAVSMGSLWLISGKSYSQCFANNMCVITRSSVLFEKIYDIRCSFI
jgi:hypothetical protein